MSLVGNLEDLGLGEILQIVSLSRKSGILELRSGGKEGAIYFRDGNVVRATSNAFRENLGSVLVQKGLVDVDTLKTALLKQRESNDGRRLGQILSEDFGLKTSDIDTSVKEQVEKIAYSFFGWMEGTFSFDLGDIDDEITCFNPLDLMLENGLNPQWIAMEGSRILDEKRHRGESLEEEPTEPVVDLESLLGEAAGAASATAADSGKASGTAKGRVFLVDDDATTTEMLADLLRESGVEVCSFSGVGDFDAMLKAAAAGDPGVVVVDMVMPRKDGSGILGGVDLCKLINEKRPSWPVLVVTDHPNPGAEETLRGYGVAQVLPKPSKAEVREDVGFQKLSTLARRIISNLAGGDDSGDGSLFNLGVELRREFGEVEPVVKGKGPESPGLFLLRGMLQELQNPTLGGGIILLVLRFASELMNRAVVFAVKEQEIVGIGQFGIQLEKGESADVRIRKMKVPLSQGSIFDKVVGGFQAVRTKLGKGEWDRYIATQLEADDPGEIFLGPILSEGKVIAFIYGDNYPEKAPVGETESYEIFLSQAGLAMEKAILERRLQTKA